LSGRFRPNATGAQMLLRGGDDLVAIAAEQPWREELAAFAAAAENDAGWPVRLEFTVERGELRVHAVTPAVLRGAALVEQVAARLRTGAIDDRQALNLVAEEDLDLALAPVPALTGQSPVAHGVPAARGVSSGIAVLSAADAVDARAAGQVPVLILRETRPADLTGLLAAAAVVTERGGSTSHAAIVTRGLGRVCVTGLTDATVDGGLRPFLGAPVLAGDPVTVDGYAGVVYRGVSGTPDAVPDRVGGAVEDVLRAADRYAQTAVRVNADTPADALAGRDRGAAGVGLCRIEHMLLGERQPLLSEILTGAASAATGEALRRLRDLLCADFTAILDVMSGLPVTVRLLDPPRHEFLPDLSDGDVVAGYADDPARLAAVRRLRETNPMLGVRGIRLAALDPALLESQIAALVAATLRVRGQGGDPRPELLVPMVTVPAEMDVVRDCLADVCVEFGWPGREPIPVGAMVETPRAALLAGRLASHADFLSIGTNDLTALVWALSRDDAEHELVPRYRDLGLLAESPFAAWDVEGVGELVRRAIADARTVKPGIRIGVCGEHVAAPGAAKLFRQAAADYVSCSPARVPVARLTAGRTPPVCQEPAEEVSCADPR
jgi:pyruvate,orthophosphate dikinase